MCFLFITGAKCWACMGNRKSGDTGNTFPTFIMLPTSVPEGEKSPVVLISKLLRTLYLDVYFEGIIHPHLSEPR